MDNASENTVIGNNITDSEIGVYTQYCGINMIYHNNFINNTKNWDDGGLTPYWWGPPVSVSIWNDDVEGNYWSDYNGTDNDGDGIGDTPYVLGENNQDSYPFMNVIPEFPSWIILPLFMIATIAVIIYRNVLRRKVC